MASTNKTQYFELSQYVSADKPTYLVDYNGDMSKIDGGLHTATVNSNTALTNIGTLTNLTTTDKTSVVSAINEVVTNVSTNTSNIGTNTNNISALDGKIGTLTNLTTANKINLVGAVNEVNGNVGDIANLTTINKSSIVSALNEADTKAVNLGTYSTDEIVIGKWIDDKPLYRRVISTSNLNFGNWTQVNIQNMSNYNVKLYDGYLYRTNQRVDRFASSVDQSSVYALLSTRSFGLEVWCASALSDGFQSAAFVIEYTKSSD